nr:N-acetylmuramoyl-L-alanine amidase [uncultured Kingella sp.]
MAKISRRALLALAALSCTIRNAWAASANTFLSGKIVPSGKNTRITLESAQRLKYTYFMLDKPNRLVIDMIDIANNNALAALPKSIKSNDPYISNARIGQKNATTTRIVFDLKQPASPQFTAHTPSGSLKHRLQIDLGNEASSNTPAPQNAPAKAPAQQPTQHPTPHEAVATTPTAASDDPLMDLLNSKQQQSQQQTQQSNQQQAQQPPAAEPQAPASNPKINRKPVIVLDAGHGGKDPGTTGTTGIHEKSVVLATALETKRQLQAKGYTVHMTRSGDTFIQLAQRRAVAQRVKADLFISIHANASANPASQGADVYVWGKANSEQARQIALAENAADKIDGLPDVGNKNVNAIISDMMQAQTSTDSAKFGKLLLAQFGKFAKLRKGSVETADFVVLRSINVPSVLIELGFLSNPDEEKQLSNNNQRHRFAIAIAEAVQQYWKTAAR